MAKIIKNNGPKIGLDVRANDLALKKAISECEIKVLSSSQMARRIVNLCRQPIEDYDLFDQFMESYGLLSYFDPLQKRNIRLTLLSLLEEGVIQLENGKYRATTNALKEIVVFRPFDDIPEQIGELMDVIKRTIIQGFSTSTSTSCKCTSSSCSSAATSGGAAVSRQNNKFKTLMCVKQII
jgi:hypothetical protein